MKHEIITLKDAATGATAQVIPALGFNCFSFRPVIAGRSVDVLWAAPDFASGTLPPTRSGIPLLFPFGGRIRGTSFRYGGREFPLEKSDPMGNAIHGFVLRQPWRVVDQSTTKVVGQFHASRDDKSLLERWPADFRITVSYELSGSSLLSDIRVDNPDQRPLPFGLGTHGYFRVPLDDGGRAEDCRVTVPVTTYWELDQLLPTGRELPTPLADELGSGMPIGQTQLDHVFGGIKFKAGQCESSIFDPQADRTVRVRFDDQFAACVVFNPPHREAICIEPYTTIPNAFELLSQGADPNLKVLPPGGSFQTRIEIRVD